MHGLHGRGFVPDRRFAIALTVGLLAFGSLHSAARADDYPDHTVKIVVPFPAGGTADAVPRIVADWLSRKWGQPVVIENRTGAAGNIGAEFVYRAAPDGYTLLSSPPPPLVVNQNLYPNLAFDPAKFEPIIVMAQVPSGLFVNPNKIKASSVPELIDYLKKNPDKVTSATQGNGTTSHLTSQLFQLLAKVKMRDIPYRGSAPALQGLLAGDVDLMFDNLGVSLPLAQAGKLKLLGGRLVQAPAVAAGHAGHGGNAARLRIGRLVRHRGAAEDAEEHRRQDQCRRERSAEAARRAGAPQAAVGGDFRRLGREDRQIHARGSRSLGQGDQGGEHQAAVDLREMR